MNTHDMMLVDTEIFHEFSGFQAPFGQRITSLLSSLLLLLVLLLLLLILLILAVGVGVVLELLVFLSFYLRFSARSIRLLCHHLHPLHVITQTQHQ